MQKQEQEFVQTNRKDEANLLRIKMNICDICKTIYNVSYKRYAGKTLKDEYTGQLFKLKNAWEMSYEKAKEHNDVEKILIEETKLAVLQKLQDKYEKMGEEK